MWFWQLIHPFRDRVWAGTRLLHVQNAKGGGQSRTSEFRLGGGQNTPIFEYFRWRRLRRRESSRFRAFIREYWREGGKSRFPLPLYKGGGALQKNYALQIKKCRVFMVPIEHFINIMYSSKPNTNKKPKLVYFIPKF